MGPKKKVLNESTLLKSSWVECNFFPFSSPLLSLEFTRAQGSLLRMLKVALALTNVRWHFDRVYGLISYQILCVMEMCFARTLGSAMQRRWTSFHVRESERTFIYQLSMLIAFYAVWLHIISTKWVHFILDSPSVSCKLKKKIRHER